MAAVTSILNSNSILNKKPSVSTFCVDLDGTLIHTDMLAESLVAAIRVKPLILFFLPFWFLQGKAVLKAKLAHYHSLKAASLPYNHAVIEYLRQRKREGNLIYLTTAAHFTLADSVANHLDLFDGVLASDGQVNNKGKEKLRQIRAMLGDAPFIYAGDSEEDLPIWKGASGAIPVGVRPSVREALKRESVPVETSFPKQKATWRTWVKELRLYQWSKNVLVFVPLSLGHQFASGQIGRALLAFLAFSFCASTFYVLNDLLDVEADRSHPRKCKRPFASGALSLAQGIACLLVGFTAVIGLAIFLPPLAQLFLLIYAAVNLLYSSVLKQTLFLDVLVLASLYTLRLLFGGAAEGVALSIWTLAFSIFLFLGLALIKRFAELLSAADQKNSRLARRAYMTTDLDAIRSFATTSMYMSVLVLALYMNSPDVLKLYTHPQVLWFVCLLVIYWVSRVMLIANRGEMSDDPVVFALKDKVSRVVAVLVVGCVLLAL